MICSSVKRFFMSNLLHQWDWTLKLRATQTGETSLAPLRLYLALELFPAAFNDIPVHISNSSRLDTQDNLG
jgi:hypothetical protein